MTAIFSSEIINNNNFHPSIITSSIKQFYYCGKTCFLRKFHSKRQVYFQILATKQNEMFLFYIYIFLKLTGLDYNTYLVREFPPRCFPYSTKFNKNSFVSPPNTKGTTKIVSKKEFRMQVLQWLEIYMLPLQPSNFVIAVLLY